jgi:hypothetical protein
MKVNYSKKFIFTWIAVVLLLVSAGTAWGIVRGSYLYNLSNFTGAISFCWPRIFVDKEWNEVYVVYQNFIRVFNETGMEIFSFGDELDLGAIVDLTVDHDSHILLLSHKWARTAERVDYELTRCNYRGEPLSRMEIKNLPSQYSSFLPNRMIYQGGNLYLANLITMQVVVTDGAGVFREAYDILALLNLDEKEKGDAMMEGFSVDGEGNILFTVPPLFRAYRITPDRNISYFGKSGGAPGRFNIVAGIGSDSRGNIFVVDKLKCAVMVYDKNFNFLNQFGSRGWKPGFLIAPQEIAIDHQDRVYVTQAGAKGVSVYKVIYD